MGFVDLTYTAFLMPLLIIFPTNNTMYSWASPVNLVLGGDALQTPTYPPLLLLSNALSAMTGIILFHHD